METEFVFKPAAMQAQVQYEGMEPVWITFDSVDHYTTFAKQTNLKILTVETLKAGEKLPHPASDTYIK